MSVTHPAAIRNTIANTVVDSIDAGTGNPEGQLILLTAGDVEVATLTMSIPAFGAAAAGIATASAITSDASATGGLATKAQLVDRDGTVIVDMSVGISGEDINLDDNNIVALSNVSITSLTYAAAV